MIKCWFGHKKSFIGVNEIPIKDPYPGICLHGCQFRGHCSICSVSSQVAMWVCRTCQKMGTQFIPRGEGIYKVAFERLVPDEKAWSNYTAIEMPVEKAE